MGLIIGAFSCISIKTYGNGKKETGPSSNGPVVGVAGFEPAASWTRTKRDTKLRHTPIALLLYSIIGSVSSLLTENCGAVKFGGSLRKIAGVCEIARGGGMFLDD